MAVQITDIKVKNDSGVEFTLKEGEFYNIRTKRETINLCTYQGFSEGVLRFHLWNRCQNMVAYQIEEIEHIEPYEGKKIGD